ncbi:hypothetical protein H0264_02460 [Nocardia huaxiensis]|uniref:Uncharacterized protein n=1 Tax=Nocardia huaxiensis TaxID=2755382 RepID=A0A7D6VF69_9NOCA|nr:hypothetical protein [Nocardia huaxiensis]QLY31255.1 hypothetical protein H0264_02460 [Nocardia huaxiensis]
MEARTETLPGPRVIAPEIAASYGRAVSTVQQQWMTNEHWPPVVGKRGRWNEYDAAEVAAVVSEHFVREYQGAGHPDDLLTVAEIAEYTGLSGGTIRADISRGRIRRDPDDHTDGVKRWKRSTIDAAMEGRRRYTRPSEPAAPADTELVIRITVPAAASDDSQPWAAQLLEQLAPLDARVRRSGGTIRITADGRNITSEA